MVRSGFACAVLALAVAGIVGFDLAKGRPAEAAAAHTITLRGKFAGSGWVRTLSRKLNKNRLIPFTLCAVWDHPSGKQFDCLPVPGSSLPPGTDLRLEQKPAGHGLRRADSPGWGMLAMSPTAVLKAPLSNDVTGNTFGTVRFRVTLRERATGRIVYRSNPFLLRWTRR